MRCKKVNFSNYNQERQGLDLSKKRRRKLTTTKKKKKKKRDKNFEREKMARIM